MQHFAASAPPESLDASEAARGAAEAALVDRLGDVAGAHVAVIGGGALEAMCALIRAGCAAVAEIAVADRVQVEPVEIVVVPLAASAQAAAQAMPTALRALLPGGRIVLRDPTGRIGGDLATVLRAHGFSAVRVQPAAPGCLVTGERPIFGRLVQGLQAGARA
jgi:hypothetical protein